jgi:heme/copper-type cytochrome/quinol oxidase subunit 3
VSPIIQAPPRLRAHTNGRVPPAPPPTGGGDDSDGDARPRRSALDNAVLATLFLIGAETMLFAGLVSAFWVLRLGAAVWPPPLQPRLPVEVTGVNTLVLVASSVVVGLAVRDLRRGNRHTAIRRFGTAAGLGALFLVVQGYEWLRLVDFGLTLGSSVYGATFYTLIGAHALHVLGALGWLGVTVLLLARGRLAGRRPAPLRACVLYWHFVVALWPILYLSVYLL